MEHFLECYLDGFKDAPRNSLHDRRTRKETVEYINTLIEGCSGANNYDTEETCKEAVTTLIQYHSKAKTSNGTVCMMGKYHNILYIAMKLCYLWQIRDAELVCQLLKEIYGCEGTFERIFIGAIFGTKAPHFIAGWKSDFENQEDNVRGVVYFLDKANRGRLTLQFARNDLFQDYKFIDLPIESCGNASPVKLTLQIGLPDKLLIFLRFGALPFNGPDEIGNLVIILDKLIEFKHSYPYNFVACLQLLLKVIPEVNMKMFRPYLSDKFKDKDVLIKDYFIEKYEDLIEDGILPPNRCGITPPELKHLCRCVIREKLRRNFCLPEGIRRLPVPERLWKYIDLLED